MSETDAVPVVRAPQTIGAYQIAGVIGRGATGIVYLARDTNGRRNVAIKVLQGGASEESEDRFAREAVVLRRLVHRHIVRIFDTGEDDGMPYLVMEHLLGRSLRDVIAANPDGLDVHAAVGIVAQLCVGLHDAHQHGLVHRDVKPANVFVTDDGAVKILDFGVAKFSESTVTADGSLVGTLAYMAPEQLSATAQIDGRADVYSAAVVLYELLTGHRPFEADSTAALLARIVHDDPAPLPASLAATPQLSELISRALEKDPARRFPSAQHFAHALRVMLLIDRLSARLLVGSEREMEEAPPASIDSDMLRETVAVPRPEVPSTTRRLSTPVGVAAALVLITALAGVAVWNRSPQPAQPRIAIEDSKPAPPPPAVAPLPSSADVLVESVPAGAGIAVDGKTLGPAPLTITLKDNQEVQFERAGYETTRVRVTPTVLQAGRLSITLTASLRVSLRASGPYPFEISAGSRVISATGSVHDIMVAAGQSVRLRSREYLLDQSVRVDRSGKTIQIPPPAKLSVRTRPVDETCTVVIDGRDFSFPPFTATLAAGEHGIELKCRDGSIRKRRVDLAPGGVHVELLR